ncbi:hypothetical protein B5C34_14850 [Pacificimonas flava]|uniref:Uncharacterized protein n=2 Tax=Pacificimonas TaxID=1960290 RepID=A0A219B0X2_9SPHN|nr:hypothetical protein B5C34_14850 [Pacificimonas flava]
MPDPHVPDPDLHDADIPPGMPDLPFWLRPDPGYAAPGGHTPDDANDSARFDPHAQAREGAPHTAHTDDADIGDDDTVDDEDEQEDWGEDWEAGGEDDGNGDDASSPDAPGQGSPQRTRQPGERQRRDRRARRLRAVADFTPVRTAPRADGWSPQVQRAFLEALAETGSVRAACQRVHRSPSTAYRLRRRTDAQGFAEAWEAALDQAALLLSDRLWDRALEGQEDVTYHPDGSQTVRRRHDNRLAMWLLRYHDPVRYGDLVREPLGGEYRKRRAGRFAGLLNGLMRGIARARSRPHARSHARPHPRPHGERV